MATRLNPYIHFKSDARAALDFYQGVFGGDLTVSTFGEFAEQGAPGGPEADLIMHGQLETPSGFTLMASDTPAHMDFTPGNTVTISLSGNETEELHGYWDKLADGADVTMPLQTQIWGDEFGMCVDKFGVEWMVNIGTA